MRLQEAYSILEIPSNSSPEEVKKKYRELAKKYHPDVNKDENDAIKFKRITEAYNQILSGETDKQEIHQGNPFEGMPFNPFGFGFNFNPFAQSGRGNRVDPVFVKLSISFKESILGVRKEIKYNRLCKCINCGGQGKITKNNGCRTCGGRGQQVSNYNNTVQVSTCPTCRGKVPTEHCASCDGKGTKNEDVAIVIPIPAGVQSDTLRLQDAGNFMGSNGFGDIHTDVLLQLTVEQDSNYRLNEGILESTVNIDLLDALKGCKIAIPTLVQDNYELDIKPMSKNKDFVDLPNFGVSLKNPHRVFINVKYPDDVNGLISFLENSNAGTN